MNNYCFIFFRLNLTCSPSLYLESHLRSDHFGSRTHLTHLAIAHCKLTTLPPRSFVGLSALTALTVAAHNADWAAAISLDIDYEAFVGLDRVLVLHLASNRILRLPTRLLCPLVSLTEVDLSYNGLTDLEDLGLRQRAEHVVGEDGDDACAELPLQRLNLSFNAIQALTPGKHTLKKTTL